MLSKKPYQTKKDFQKALDGLYNFHQRCFSTIVELLNKTGDVTITEEEEDDFKFDYLEYEGTYWTSAIHLTKDKKSFYLEAYDKYGERQNFYWDDINHDVIIEEMIVERLFDELKGKEDLI